MAPVQQAATDWKKKGNAYLADGRLDDAVECYRHAVCDQPDDAHAHLNLGFGLIEQGDLTAAVDSLNASIACDSRQYDAHYLLGRALALQGLDVDAVAKLRQAVSLKPDFDIGHRDLGQALERLERFDEALAAYRCALLAKPDFNEVMLSLLRLLLQGEHYGEALIWADRLLRFDPDSDSVQAFRAHALYGLTRYAEMLAITDKILSRQPDHAQTWHIRGNAMFALRRYEEAAQAYEQTLAHHPDTVEALTNCGAAYQQLGRYGPAIACFERALVLKPEHARASNNMGITLIAQARCRDALAFTERALKLHPNNALLHWNKAVAHLLLGEFDVGWVEHEWRWQTFSQDLVKPVFVQPAWTGLQSLQGRAILIYHEQGLGDSLQFVRYALGLRARGAAKVYIRVPRALEQVLRGIAGDCIVLSDGDPLPAFDFHCPMLSLPMAFGTTLDTVPAPIPYLSSDPAKQQEWQARLGTRRGLRVGLVWSGNASHKNDRNRSIALAQFVDTAWPALQIISLQKEVRDHDRQTLDEHPEILHFESDLKDFSDTAALIDCMDLVISVDTSVAHLAGAMGRPLWLLLPHHVDWRWLLDRTDSPWYPTARLFRQSAGGDWTSVLGAVISDLQTLCKAESS